MAQARTVITSKSNERVKALRKGFRGKASRPGELVSLEGPKLLEEAGKAGVQIEALFVQHGREDVFAQVAMPQVHVLSTDVFQSVVDTQTPNGIAVLARIPKQRPFRIDAMQGFALLLESVQDPGNLGTLIRSADAFGAEAVLLMGECANPWSPKVLRASAGSVFRMPIIRLHSLPGELTRPNVCSYAAVAKSESAGNLLEAELEFPCVLMVGNEGTGLSQEAVDVATHKLWIPCTTESLNAGVAGSLLLYEAMRQRRGGK